MRAQVLLAEAAHIHESSLHSHTLTTQHACVLKPHKDPTSIACDRAWLRVCITGDPLCLPMQLGTDLAAQAAYSAAHCPVPQPQKGGLLVRVLGSLHRLGAACIRRRVCM